MQARKVAAVRGLRWFHEGWQLFRRDPIMWAGLALTWTIAASLLAFIPVIGPIAGMLLFSIGYAGLMLGAREVEAGGMLRVGLLWQALSEPAVRTQLFVLAIAPLGFGIVANALALTLGMTALTAALISVASIIMSLAIVFAVPLIYFDRYEAVAAMKASFGAALLNAVPMTIFLVVNLLVGSIAVPLTFGFAILLLMPLTSCAVYRAYRDIFGGSHRHG